MPSRSRWQRSPTGRTWKSAAPGTRRSVIPFLASLKLNFYTYICSSTKQPDGMPRPLLDPKIMELLRRHAMLERVQMLHHLNYFDRLYGLYKRYPELKGQGDKAVCEGEHYKFAKRDIPVICLAAALEGDPDRDARGAGRAAHSGGQCLAERVHRPVPVRRVSEDNADAGGEQAGPGGVAGGTQKYPALGLHIFYSQGDATPATAKALAALPPDVRIERVYGIYKPFLDAAAQGD